MIAVIGPFLPVPDLLERTEGKELEPAVTRTELVLLCHARGVRISAEVLAQRLKDFMDEQAYSVKWSGTSLGLHQGVIILECQGRFPLPFLQKLSTDTEVFDYILSELPTRPAIP